MSDKITMKSHIDFNKIPGLMAATDEAVSRGVLAAAIDVHGQAVELVPVLTGNLKGSLSWSGQSITGGYEGADAPPIATSRDRHTAHVGTNVVYGPSVEFGGKGRSPKSYLRAAMGIKEQDAKAIIARYIKAGAEGATR